ncbi:ABC transporter ATP-binding protein [Mesorhizobium sp. CCNWLW179-1]|uniref:ABC transporter ATP-binding protein n=1 Tax=unclassified Mesorhizobium TaxID=325217 RepID=UPI003014A8CF
MEQQPSECLIAEGVTVRFGGLRALSDINLTLRPSEIVGLIGPNGAGKTTLVNCLSGFQKPTSGSVIVNNASTASWTAADFRFNGVARTFQSGRLFTDLTVRENIEVPLVALGMSRAKARREATALLEQTGLAASADKDAATLPYTDERRVGIARALAMQPSYLLLDEPAAGMSDSECEELMAIVQSLPRQFGCGVLLIEHNMTVVMNVSDRIHVLDVGQTLAEGRAEEIRGNLAVIDAYLGSEL